jgi:hypothetical protein
MASSSDESPLRLDQSSQPSPAMGPASGWQSLADILLNNNSLPPLPDGPRPPVESAPPTGDAELLRDLQRSEPELPAEAPESIFSDAAADDEDVFGLAERKTVELPSPLVAVERQKAGPVANLTEAPPALPGLLPTAANLPTPPRSSVNAVAPTPVSPLPAMPVPPASSWPPAKADTELPSATQNPIWPVPSATTVTDSLNAASPVLTTPTTTPAAIATESAAPRHRWLTWVLLVYAILATVAALAGWFQGLPGEHPLSIIPDTFGEYGPAQRKKVSLRIDPDAELPAQLRVTLGNSVRIGDLEVAPKSIAEQKVAQLTEIVGASKPVRQTLPKPLLVLRAKLTNHSPDVSLNPVDPALNRKAVWGEPAVAGLYFADHSRVLGGPIAWPFGNGIRRIYLEGQEADDKPLEPGESREVLIAAAANPELVLIVREAKNPILWKLHLRRGRIQYGLRDRAVTTLVGVEFRAEQVQWLDQGKSTASLSGKSTG